ncbi:12885_t:CDS:1, partial [Gigaspora margarita]
TISENISTSDGLNEFLEKKSTSQILSELNRSQLIIPHRNEIIKKQVNDEQNLNWIIDFESENFEQSLHLNIKKICSDDRDNNCLLDFKN